MDKKEQDLQKVKDLLHGQKCYIAWSEERVGEVHRIYDTLFLQERFKVPQYGGSFFLSSVVHVTRAEELVDVAYSWT